MTPTGVRDLPFAKWQGCGNDYLFVDLRGATRERIAAVEDLAPNLASAWSHRRFGIGSDGLVLLLADNEVDLRLAMWNADGSRGAICGTALRCATAMLAEERGGYAAHLRLASDAGLHSTRVERDLYGELRASVEIGPPRFAATDVPFDPDLAPTVTGGE
ncbi:MAG: diaminopimelate epimerase, partial [Planctomycetota bacterium]